MIAQIKPPLSQEAAERLRNLQPRHSAAKQALDAADDLFVKLDAGPVMEFPIAPRP